MMTKNRGDLQRRPFLTPIWLTVLGALVGVCFLSFAAWVWGTADSTIVVVVRHAEKELQGDDPALTPVGQARAELLARMFGNDSGHGPGHIDALYVTPTVRAGMTVAPLAARTGLMPVAYQEDAAGLARRVLREHAGGRVLVVGHTDTVPAIVESLTGARDIPSIAAGEYGTLYIVTVPRIGRADYLRLNY